jgi:hypothetical protein
MPPPVPGPTLNVQTDRLAPGFLVSISPEGSIVNTPLNTDCVMLARVVSYDQNTHTLRWRSAWSPTAPEFDAFVYMSNKFTPAGDNCKLITGDLTVVYRAPMPGKQADSSSVVFSDWVVFIGGAGDAECSPGVTLYASKIILTDNCEDPFLHPRVEIDAEKIFVAQPSDEGQLSFKDVLFSKVQYLQLCNFDPNDTGTVEVPVLVKM